MDAPAHAPASRELQNNLTQLVLEVEKPHQTKQNLVGGSISILWCQPQRYSKKRYRNQRDAKDDVLTIHSQQLPSQEYVTMADCRDIAQHQWHPRAGCSVSCNSQAVCAMPCSGSCTDRWRNVARDCFCFARSSFQLVHMIPCLTVKPSRKILRCLTAGLPGETRVCDLREVRSTIGIVGHRQKDSLVDNLRPFAGCDEQDMGELLVTQLMNCLLCSVLWEDSLSFKLLGP